MSGTQTDRINGISSSVAVKAPVVAATTANITLYGTQTIDDIAIVADDRVLVKDQTDSTENGIYLCKATTWERDKDFDGARDAVKGTSVLVNSGTTNANTYWKVSSSDPFVIGTDAITWASFGVTGPTGATGPQGPAGADGTVDISTLTNLATLDDTADEFILRDNSDSGNNKAITVGLLLTLINALTAETAVDDADLVAIYDADQSTADKATVANLFKAITTLTSATAATGDELLISDADDSNNAKKITIQGILDLLGDTSSYSAETTAAVDDLLRIYDTTEGADNSMTFANFFKVINALTADASPDSAADYVVTYDASATAAKKVLLQNLAGSSAATTTTAGIVELATAAEVQTGSDTGRVPSVSVLGSHRSACKFWIDVSQSGGTPSNSNSYNVTSITDTGTGDLRVTIATDFSTANWCCQLSIEEGSSAPGDRYFVIDTKTVGTVDLRIWSDGGSAADPANGWQVSGYGDQ